MKKQFVNILIKKFFRYSLLAIFCYFLQDILSALSIITFFSPNLVKILTINTIAILFAVILCILCIWTFRVSTMTTCHIMIKKHQQFIKIALFLIGILVIYKCITIWQLLVFFIEFGVAYLLLDKEVNKEFGYQFLESNNSDSNYIEKSVVGRNNLTNSQKEVLDRLITLIDQRTMFDSFNIGLIGEWGSGKTSITDTLIHEFENRENSHKYFILKISVLTLNRAKNIVTYVNGYFESLFRKYEIDIWGGSSNVAFLTSLTKLFGNNSSVDKVLDGINEEFFIDLENEKLLFIHQVQKLLKISGRKNFIFIIDDMDRSDEEQKALSLLVEFASISGIISIISLDKKKDVIIRPQITNDLSDNKEIYNSIDKYIHVRIRVSENNHIEYDKKISAQILTGYIHLVPKENCFIACNGENNRKSLFEAVRDYQTTEIINPRMSSANSYNILTELFFFNMKKSNSDFGNYFENLVNEYIYNSKELFPYVQQMLSINSQEWNLDLSMIIAQWTNSFGDEKFDWLTRLQSNSGTMFWTLCQEIQALDMVAKISEKIQNEILTIEDVFDYFMIQEMPFDNRTWENRKENPITYSGFDQLKLIVFDDVELSIVNGCIQNNDFSSVRNIFFDKTKNVANLFLLTILLADFMEYFRSVLNNYRTFKMQLREAELLEMNYLDYLIKEWQPRRKVIDNFEEMKKNMPLFGELNIGWPSLSSFVNQVLFENYVLRFGNRFINNELKNGRLFVYHGEKRNIIVISFKDKPLNNNFYLDTDGQGILSLDNKEIYEIENRIKQIWIE